MASESSPQPVEAAGGRHRAPRRPTLNVDLGPLRTAVDAASMEAEVKPSVWVRQAVQWALDGTRGAFVMPAGTQETNPDRGDGTYRAWFDAEQTAKLDLIVARTGRRSRIKALHALLDGVQVGASASGANLGDAVQALARSNHELVAVGRNLNQVARSLNAYPGKTTVADRMAIERVLATLRGHLEDAARLVAELRPVVKTKPGKGAA